MGDFSLFLKNIGLEKYFQNFKEAGVDDLETAASFSEAELEQHVKIELLGYRRKLWLKLKSWRDKDSLTRSCQPGPSGSKQPLKQTFLVFSSGSLSQKLANYEEKLKLPSDQKWSKYILPNARFPRTMYFNEITLAIYNAAAEALGTKFEEYLIKERRKQWDSKEKIEKLQKAVARISSHSEDETYIARLRSIPVPAKPSDATSCSSALTEIDKCLDEVTELKTEKECAKQKLFVGDTTKLQTWASEQLSYVTTVLEELDRMIDLLTGVRGEVQQTKEKLAAIYRFKLHSAERKRKRKRKHDNKNKSKRRKQQRAANRDWDLVSLVMNEKAPRLQEVAELTENGSIKVKRQLELSEINTEYMNKATPVLYYSTHVAMFVKASVLIPIMHCIHNISPSTKSSEQCS